MIRAAAFTVGLVVVAPAAAVGQTLSINNEAGVPQPLVSQIEQAAVSEVNGPVHLFYSSAQTISWDADDPASWQVNLIPAASWSCPPTIPTGCWGYHLYGLPTGTVAPGSTHHAAQPEAYVRWDNNNPGASEYAFSHEVVEMAADPYGTAEEICDPVAWQGAFLDGVVIAAFQEPNGVAWPPGPAMMPTLAPPAPSSAHSQAHWWDWRWRLRWRTPRLRRK
jgi:hypothetical protein